MALEATFRQLNRQLKKLQDNLVALRLTVSEDKPLNGESALADQLEDSVLDAMGFLEECLKESGLALKAARYPVDLDRARCALTVCQERFHQAERRFAAELVSYEKLRDLASLGGKRGGAWFSWGNTVKHGLEQCRSPMEAVSSALAGCWQEIAERVGTTSVSVRTTNIGQKIVARSSELEDRGLSKGE
jgi:hypothetical protein